MLARYLVEDELTVRSRSASPCSLDSHIAMSERDGLLCLPEIPIIGMPSHTRSAMLSSTCVSVESIQIRECLEPCSMQSLARARLSSEVWGRRGVEEMGYLCCDFGALADVVYLDVRGRGVLDLDIHLVLGSVYFRA